MLDKIKNLEIALCYEVEGVEGVIKNIIRDEKDVKKDFEKVRRENDTEYDFYISREVSYIDILENMLGLKKLIRNGKDLEEVLTRIEKHCQNIRKIAKEEGVL